MKAITLSDENFDTTITQSNVPVLVDFWADWCGPCKMLSPIIDELAVEQQSNAVVAKVNVDDSPSLAQRYNVTAIPTLIVFRDGQAVETIQGVQSKSALAASLEKAAALA